MSKNNLTILKIGGSVITQKGDHLWVWRKKSKSDRIGYFCHWKNKLNFV